MPLPSLRTTRLTGCEVLEIRRVFSGIPWGASAQDTAEYMIGDVWVTVAALESTGELDPDTENWTWEQRNALRQVVQSGVQWWETRFAELRSAHELNFHFDLAYLDQPLPTRYEPISRRSEDVNLWIDDFLAGVGFDTPADFGTDIRSFNHAQRSAHHTDWAFTILLVNAAQDTDGRFADDGDFLGAFAYPGGQFFVVPSGRPASTFAHETGHMFWALDEYSGSRPYSERRGYYNTLNSNAADGNPAPGQRELSIMDRAATAYAAGAISQSAREMIGWRDSDRDGILDVLDVPIELTAQATWLASEGVLSLVGEAAVGVLPNLNPSGTGRAITLNRIGLLEYRVNHASWLPALRVDQPTAEFQLKLTEFDLGPQTVELRARDDRWNVVSEPWSFQFEVGLAPPLSPLDVSRDGYISPIDALLVINQLNGWALAGQNGGVFAVALDTNGDGALSPLDALRVINYLNRAAALPVGHAVVSFAAAQSPQKSESAERGTSGTVAAGEPTLLFGGDSAWGNGNIDRFFHELAASSLMSFPGRAVAKTRPQTPPAAK